MGGTKKWIYELLESEELGAYLKKMFDAQTAIILEKIDCHSNDCHNEKVAGLEQMYQQEMERRIQNEHDRLQVLLNKEKEMRMLAEKEVEKAEQKARQLQLCYESVQKEKNDIEVFQKKLIYEQKEEIQKLEAEKDELRNVFEEYKKRYQRIDEAYTIYKELSPEVKDRLRNIFKADSIYALIAACSDWRNVEGIWQFTKRRIVEKESRDTESLVKLFQFMLEAYNAQGNEKKYMLIEPRVGERFDSDRQIIMGTKTDGIIAKVRLYGIASWESGEVVQKALIEV